MFRLDRLVVISSVQEPSIISRVETLALKSLSELGDGGPWLSFQHLGGRGR